MQDKRVFGRQHVPQAVPHDLAFGRPLQQSHKFIPSSAVRGMLRELVHGHSKDSRRLKGLGRHLRLGRQDIDDHDRADGHGWRGARWHWWLREHELRHPVLSTHGQTNLVARPAHIVPLRVRRLQRLRSFVVTSVQEGIALDKCLCRRMHHAC